MSLRWPQPDFLHATARPRRPLLAWVWAVCGVALLVASATEAVVAQRANEARSRQLARAELRVAKARAATPAARQALVDRTTSAGAAASSAATSAVVIGAVNGVNAANAVTAINAVTALHAAQRVRAQLDHPWASVLSSLEAETPAGVQWLHFDHDIGSPELRVEGLSAQRDSGLELVEQLSARVGWSDVVLGRLQAPEASASGAAWRFDIRARVEATAQFRAAP